MTVINLLSLSSKFTFLCLALWHWLDPANISPLPAVERVVEWPCKMIAADSHFPSRFWSSLINLQCEPNSLDEETSSSCGLRLQCPHWQGALLETSHGRRTLFEEVCIQPLERRVVFQSLFLSLEVVAALLYLLLLGPLDYTPFSS